MPLRALKTTKNSGYRPLDEGRPVRQTRLVKQLKELKVWSRNCLVEKGLLENRQQKHDRRVNRDTQYLGGIAGILNKHGGAAALQAVRDDKEMSSILTPCLIKQSKPQESGKRRATRIELRIEEDQVVVHHASVGMEKRAGAYRDASLGTPRLDESTKKQLMAALNHHVIADAMASQGF